MKVPSDGDERCRYRASSQDSGVAKFLRNYEQKLQGVGIEIRVMERIWMTAGMRC